MSGSQLLFWVLQVVVPFAFRKISERQATTPEELMDLYRQGIQQNRDERAALLAEFDADPAVADLVAKRREGGQ